MRWVKKLNLVNANVTKKTSGVLFHFGLNLGQNEYFESKLLLYIDL